MTSNHVETPPVATSPNFTVTTVGTYLASALATTTFTMSPLAGLSTTMVPPSTICCTNEPSRYTSTAFDVLLNTMLCVPVNCTMATIWLLGFRVLYSFHLFIPSNDIEKTVLPDLGSLRNNWVILSPFLSSGLNVNSVVFSMPNTMVFIVSATPPFTYTMLFLRSCSLYIVVESVISVSVPKYTYWSTDLFPALAIQAKETSRRNNNFLIQLSVFYIVVLI